MMVVNGLLMVLLIVLMCTGMPVSIALGLTSLGLMLNNFGTINFFQVGQMMISGMNSFTVLAIPMFILAGKLMNSGGITRRLFAFCRSIVGWLPGGLGHVNVMASVLFAGMSGTAVSDAGGLGAIEIHAMRDSGFDNEFACAITATSSTIGPIIPPSLPLVIYGTVAATSVGALLIAGLVPGLVMAVAMMIVVAIFAIKKKYPRDKFPTLRGLVLSFTGAILPLMTPVIILLGIFTGIFTPTEAAAIVVVYSMLLSCVVYHEIGFKKLLSVFKESILDCASIGMILATSNLFGKVLVSARIPQQLLESFDGLLTTKFAFWTFTIIFMLLIGCFMETLSAITILVPLLAPMIAAFDVNFVHFGVIMVLLLMIGVLTPPFGIVLFVIAKVGNISVPKLTKALLPWILCLLLVAIVLILLPEITLFVPRLAGMPV